jgi:hypothetical protein
MDHRARRLALSRPADDGLARRIFGASPERRLALLRAAWPAAVGAELERRTQVLALEGTTLRLKVADASWRKTLLKVKGPILARLEAIAGDMAPSRLSFCEGEIASVPASAPAPPDPPAAVPSGALAEAAARIEDADLRARFLVSASRYLARARP